jgi:amino acid transporter
VNRPHQQAANAALTDDERQLARLGYQQELARRMSGFSNLAISLSIICILAGGITSFHLAYCSVGPAAVCLGWPLASVFSLIVALTMAQVASAFPTAGGLYHWAAILGGRGWGWATAWFNLFGLVTVLAAINVGMWQFTVGAFFPELAQNAVWQLVAMAVITGSQALVNHWGIKLTTKLTDFSGYWILFIAVLLTGMLLCYSSSWDFGRLITFVNYSGLPEPPTEAVWPRGTSLVWLFALGLLLPAYTITGFDASAHVSEETVEASTNVPSGIVRSVIVSGVSGWILLIAIVLAIPDLDAAAQQGTRIVPETIRSVLPYWLARGMLAAIALAQYLCGLATVTSASRMAYAFARDGGLPFSQQLKRVSPRFQTPAIAIWTVAACATLFTVFAPIYATISAVCTILLYVSYVLPTALGWWTYGRSWRRFGPFSLGAWYRPLAGISVIGCVGLLLISVAPPNQKAGYVLAIFSATLLVLWFAVAKWRFQGPPLALLDAEAEDA